MDVEKLFGAYGGVIVISTAPRNATQNPNLKRFTNCKMPILRLGTERKLLHVFADMLPTCCRHFAKKICHNLDQHGMLIPQQV